MRARIDDLRAAIGVSAGAWIKSPESGLKYFLLGSFATAFFLYGIALTFGATGTTNIADIAAALPHSATPGFATLAVAMILIGIGFKVSAAPFRSGLRMFTRARLRRWSR